MTKKEMFVHIATVCAADEAIVEFCNHEIELLGRKKGSSKPTKTQVENEAIKTKILEILGEANDRMTCGDVVKALDGNCTSQKISALLRQLVNAEKVEKVVEKKVSYFALA